MPGTVYTVASGKGGVGKTTTSVNLAVALWREGNAVALVDADIGMANLAAVLDLEPEETLHDVLAGRATVDEAVIEAKDGDLMVLPGSRSLDSFADADPKALRAAVSDLAARADYVIVDTGAGLSYEDVLPLGMADGVVLVTTPDPAAFGDTMKTMEIADILGAPVRGLVVTRAVEDTDSAAIAAEIGAELLGTIPEDPAVMASTVAGDPLESHAPDSEAAAAYRDLADAVLSGDEEWLAAHAREPADEPPEAVEPVEPVGPDEAGGAADDDAPGTDVPTGRPDEADEDAAGNPPEAPVDAHDESVETPPADVDAASADDDDPGSGGAADPDDETATPTTDGEPDEDVTDESATVDEDPTDDDEGSAETEEPGDAGADEASEADAVDDDAATVHDEDEAESGEAVDPTEEDDADEDERDTGVDEGDGDGEAGAEDERVGEASAEDDASEDDAEPEEKRGGFFGWLGRLFS